MLSEYETEQAVIDEEIEDILEIVQVMTTLASECLSSSVPISVDNQLLSTICFGVSKSKVCDDMDFLNDFRKERIFLNVFFISKIKKFEDTFLAFIKKFSV